MLQSPDWVSFEAEQTEGLDLLGLRAPVQAIGNGLFNGVTTVTPKLRYFSVVTWIIWRYAQAKLPNTWSSFSEFAAAQEAAIVMANLLKDRNVLNLVGANAGRTRLDSGKKTLPLSRLVQNIAFNIYISSSRDLNLTHEMDDGFTGLTKDRGLELARAFNEVMSGGSYESRLSRKPMFDHVPRHELEGFVKDISLDRIPSREREILIDALMPAQPEEEEWDRLRNYALLLWLSQEKGEAVHESDLFAAAMEPPIRMPSALRPLMDRWLTYIVRDNLAVAHEAVFAAVMQQVDVKSAERGAPAIAADVVAAMLARKDEYDDILRQFRLLRKGETVATLSFAELRERVERRCRNNEIIANGLRRWNGGLKETDLYEASLADLTAAAALLPVAWCLTAHRVVDHEAVSAGRDLVRTGGIYQIGIGDVVLPKIEEFCIDKRPVLEVMGELITRTVQQHLRIAWSRFASPRGKDVSVLVADAETWSRHNGFQPGRTDSRLWVAITWLRQLELVHDGGLTKGGARVLQRCLRMIGAAGD